jgi:hypothetical protein
LAAYSSVQRGYQIHARLWHGHLQQIAHLAGECLRQRIPPHPVLLAHPPHMPRQVTLAEEVGQRRLLQQGGVDIGEPARGYQAVVEGKEGTVHVLLVVAMVGRPLLVPIPTAARFSA